MPRVKDHRILVLALTAALAASCSSGGHGHQGLFIACMRHHGVKLPEPGPGGRIAMPAVPPAKLQTALQACQRFQTTPNPTG